MSTSMTQNDLTPPVGRVAGSRKRRRWLPWLAAAIVLCLAAAGAFLYLVLSATLEARDLAPWPGLEVSASEAATVDLAPLGLHVSGSREASEVYGTQASFNDGAVIEYVGAGDLRVTVAALRYASPAGAGNDFEHIKAWAEDSCGWQTSGYLGYAGVIRCGLSDGHDRILWAGNWILDITATNGGELERSELVDKVRDALAAQWHRRPARQPGGLSG
jgi:hypothetical protein